MRCFYYFNLSGFHVELKSRATYLAVGMWLLVTVVLSNAYAGVLFSFLSVAKLEPAINSLEELAHSNTVQLVTLTAFEYTKQLLVF